MDIVGVGSHQQVLLEAIKISGNKPILELGAGDFSTQLIHSVAEGRKIITVDHNQKWLDRYAFLKSKDHSFLQVDVESTLNFYKEDNTNWGVVFVDSITWEVRMLAINKYKDTSDYLVIHDTGYSAKTGKFGKEIKLMTDKDPGLRDFSSYFKYWREYLPINWTVDDPPTVLGSNFFNLDSVIIKMMIEINSSE
jgi:hypothetical protein